MFLTRMEIGDKFVVFCYIFSAMGIVMMFQLQQLINLPQQILKILPKDSTSHCPL